MIRSRYQIQFRKILYGFFIFGLMNLNSFIFILACEAQDNCKPVFSRMTALTLQDPNSYVDADRLGYHPTISQSMPVRRSHAEMLAVFVYDPAGNKIAEFPYRISKDQKTLFIGYLQVDPSAQGHGISEAMMAQVLLEHPKIRTLESKLEDANARVIRQKLSEGLSLEEAILESPSGKMKKKFGFSKFLEIEDRSYLFFVRMGRSK